MNVESKKVKVTGLLEKKKGKGDVPALPSKTT